MHPSSLLFKYFFLATADFSCDNSSGWDFPQYHVLTGEHLKKDVVTCNAAWCQQHFVPPSLRQVVCCERLRILRVQAVGVFWGLKLETVEAWFFIWFPGSALDSSLGHHLEYLGFDASGPNVYISEGGDS